MTDLEQASNINILTLQPAAASNAFNRDSSRCLDGLITREGEHPVACGGHADIWKGQLGGRGVAVKMVRPWSSNGKRHTQDKLLKSLWREYLTWSSLSHPNVIELLGFSYDFSPDWFVFPSLISPWMSNGTVDLYIEENTSADCLRLLVGIGEGLSYLHSREPPIVHGDLRAGNVLVSNSGDPCLSDFGLSRALNETRQTPNSGPVGSLRWMAPELFRDDSGVSVHSDIWAFGMTILELFTGKLPYSATKNDAFVLGKLTDGVIPERPGAYELVRPEFNDDIWKICRQCWNLEPTRRPSMRDITNTFLSSMHSAHGVESWISVHQPEGSTIAGIQIDADLVFDESSFSASLHSLYSHMVIYGHATPSPVPFRRPPQGSTGGGLADLIDLMGTPPVEASVRTLIQMYDALYDIAVYKDECRQLHKRLVGLLLDIRRIQASNDGRYIEFAKWTESIIERFSSKFLIWSKWETSTTPSIIDRELKILSEDVSRCSNNLNSGQYPPLPLQPSLQVQQQLMFYPSPHSEAPMISGSSPSLESYRASQIANIQVGSSTPHGFDPTEKGNNSTHEGSPQFSLSVRKGGRRRREFTSKMGDNAGRLDGSIELLDFTYRSLGRSTNIRQGRLSHQIVAIKTIRPPSITLGTGTRRQGVLERFWIKWTRSSSLSHPNILSYLGYTYDFSANSPIFPSIVSPWMANGTLPSYLEENPSVNKHELFLGVARGLSYLHTRRPPIVHGNLRAENILVSQTGIPCLNVLHLSEIFENGGLRNSQNAAIESLRWMSPELLREDTQAGKKSDVWAYAMTILETITGKFPYDDVKGPAAVLRYIRSGNIPSRPATFLDDHLWELCTECWEVDVARRKSMFQVIADLSVM